MNMRREDVQNDQPLVRFLDRVRKSFSHDLRTPLGSIVNYAAVLEAHQGAEAEEVRDLGRRIRTNAQRMARMVQLLATATGLAGRPMRMASTDLLTLARAVLTDAKGRGQIRVGQDPGGALATVDAEVVGFAWRAYVAVESDACGRAIDEAELIVRKARDDLSVELRCGLDPAIGTGAAISEARVELPSYLRHNGGPARLESSMGLSLAEDLVVSHGGDLEVWGRPGARSGLRVRFPTAA